MSAVLYPVAANAAAALNAPLGRAARASEARLLAGGAVAFVSESTGPAFVSREAALDAFAGRLDDERPGRTHATAPEDRYCALRELADGPPPKPGKSMPPVPVYRDGRRWAPPRKSPATVWRMSVSYWKIVQADAEPILEHPPGGEPGSARAPAKAVQALRERLNAPMTPVKPQQPLDIGLFEFRPPDAPHIVMPDD